jgi:hypothetical protein
MREFIIIAHVQQKCLSLLCRFFTGEQGMRSFPFQQNRVRRGREANNKYKYHPCSVAQVIDFSLNTLSKAGSRQTHGRRRLHQTRSQSFSRACMHKYIIVVEKEARDFHAHITIYTYMKREYLPWFCWSGQKNPIQVPQTNSRISKLSCSPATHRESNSLIYTQDYAIVIYWDAFSLTSAALSKVSLVISIYLAANLLLPRAKQFYRCIRNALRCVERSPLAWDVLD